MSNTCHWPLSDPLTPPSSPSLLVQSEVRHNVRALKRGRCHHRAEQLRQSLHFSAAELDHTRQLLGRALSRGMSIDTITRTYIALRTASERLNCCATVVYRPTSTRPNLNCAVLYLAILIVS